jgi:hypothetical protein
MTFWRGDDPDAEKAALEASYCDPQVREPFIASLALASNLAGLYLTHALRHESVFGWVPDSSGEGKVSGRSECAPY